jgi:hypothetical protein
MHASRTDSEILAYKAINYPYNWGRHSLAPLSGAKQSCTRSWLSGAHGRLATPMLGASNASILRLRLGRTLPSALPGFLPDVQPVPPCTHQGIGYNHHRRNHHPKRPSSPQTPPATTQQYALACHHCTRTKGDQGRIRTKGDYQRGNPNRPCTHSTTSAPAIMNARDSTAKRNLILRKQTHQRQTRINTLGDVPPIIRQPISIVHDDAPRQLSRLGIIPTPTIPDAPAKCTKWGMAIPAAPLVLFLPLPRRAQTHIISQQALTAMVTKEAASLPAAFSPRCLIFVDTIPNYAHYASLVVHLVTGEHIASYKRLMNDPDTAKTWQTAFGKDFGTGQMETNSIFVMTHDKIRALPKDQVATYAKVSWISARKRKIQIVFKSLWVGTSSRISEICLPARLTLQSQNSCGIVF